MTGKSSSHLAGWGWAALVGARLARLTTDPDLCISDGEYRFLGQTPQLGKTVDFEGWIPFPRVFEVLQTGKRHVVMGSNQRDRYGNQNLSAFGPLQHPKRQMFGVRGAPGNTINHPTSYWVPRHSARVFTESVDIVCGIGFDKADERNPAFDHLNIHLVVTDLGVFDFGGPGHAMRARSLHPGVTPEQVAENTGFPVADLDSAPVTATPTPEQLSLIREVLDPECVRNREVRS